MFDSTRVEQEFLVRKFESNKKSLFEGPSRARVIARSKISSSSRADGLARSMFDSKCSKCSKKCHVQKYAKEIDDIHT